MVDQELVRFLISLANQLKQQRFSVNQEKKTQAEIAEFLSSMNYSVEREKPLSAKDTPDFLLHCPSGGCIAVEVKTRYQRKAIYRQLERYAAHDKVRGIILITGTSMGLPAEIKGKPTILVSLGEGWL